MTLACGVHLKNLLFLFDIARSCPVRTHPLTTRHLLVREMEKEEP